MVLFYVMFIFGNVEMVMVMVVVMVMVMAGMMAILLNRVSGTLVEEGSHMKCHFRLLVILMVLT